MIFYLVVRVFDFQNFEIEECRGSFCTTVFEF